ncbi:MAG: FecCD family ABC transporter permease [Wujia sp.]
MKDKTRYTILYIALLVACFAVFLFAINMGSVSLSIKEVLSILTKRHVVDTNYRIIWNIRMPRVLAAMLLGGALSVSGLLLQIFFRNPIAGPFVLGISSGAKLTVALAMVFLLEQGVVMSSSFMIIVAFVGSMLSMGVVLLVAGKVRDMSMLVVCGVMIGNICSAITDFVVTFAQDSNIVNLHNWSLGSFAGIHAKQLQIAFFIIMVSIFFAIWLSKPMSAYQLGENYAENLGVNIRVFRIVLICISSLLSACVTAFAGPISFVGIAVPHLMKNLFQTAKPIYMIPACFLGGGIICVLCDMVARTVFAPIELSISSVTAVALAPVVLWMMIANRTNRRE